MLVKNGGMAPVKQLMLPLEVPEGEPDIGERVETGPERSSSLMMRVVERENLRRALHQVRRNRGAPGIDGMSVDALPDFLRKHWPSIRERLLTGRYRPKAVRRVLIPKPDGRTRTLGIPTVLDRFIQQAMAQVLQEVWEPVFHDESYGFRPKRSAHQAVRQAQSYIRQGKRWVVDIDFESFFDHVNHDRLMRRIKSRTCDSVVLRSVNAYLKAGVWDGERVVATSAGVPQGGPLSPLLSNIVLDELDWELGRRGHSFVRYADDCQVYVGSRIAGERVMSGLERYVECTLKLRVNEAKSAVARPWNRVFLGFTFTRSRGHRIRVAAGSLSRLKAGVRILSRRTRGHALRRVIAELREMLVGWKAYYGLSEVPSPLRDVDKWTRRRMRSYQLKQWGRARYRMLRKLGVERQLAWNTTKSAHGVWRLSASPALYHAMPNRYFRDLGLPELATG
jgi:group II intron reverse transcriptase/maturase